MQHFKSRWFGRLASMNTRWIAPFQTFHPGWVVALGLAGLVGQVAAQTAPAKVPAPAPATATAMFAQTPLAPHPWIAVMPRLAAEAYFANLVDGEKIETPFLVKFGLSGGWGLAPIAAPMGGKSGHHHLLVNRDLPLDFKQALPFTDQYIHFGKGQMETVLNLAPGNYKLRMLLADDKHLPHFVYSKPLSITVIKKIRPTPKHWLEKASV